MKINIIGNLRDWHSRLAAIKQCCPKFSEINEIDNLALRLQGKNEDETISNILEWQDKNIEYWYERSDLSLISFFFSVLGISIIAVCISLGTIIPLLKLLLLMLLFIPLFLININHNKLYFIVTFLIEITFATLWLIKNPQLLLMKIQFFGIWTVQISEFLFVLIVISGIIISNFIYAIFKNYHFLHKNIKKNNLKNLYKLFISMFNVSLSLKDILNYKIAVCRDYAKLTIAILLKLNIHPYLLQTSNHAAGAVKINNNYYVIDQRLPIQIFDKWKCNQKGKIRIYEVLKEFNSDGKEKITLNLIKYEPHTNGLLSQSKDIIKKNLENDIDNFFPRNDDAKYEKICEFPINVDSFFYDEVTHFSIVRLIKKRIDDEFGYNIKVFSKIEIEPNKDDLSVKIY